jgi:hypothetical protein
MLDPWIIDEILKREQEQRQEHERQRAELPIEAPIVTPARPTVTQDEPERGVMIIDI